jgi:hypothetical protein
MTTGNDIFSQDRNNAIKNWAIGAGCVVYLLMVVYSAIHNISLMLKGVNKDAQILAIVGIVGLEITAIFLPIALHYWSHETSHKIFAFLFYIVDFGLISMNVIADWNANAGDNMPGWVHDYVSWVAPISPVICGIGWAILWMIDPAQKEQAMNSKVAAITRKAYVQHKANFAAQNGQYQSMIEQAAHNQQYKEGLALLGISIQDQPQLLPPPLGQQVTPPVTDTPKEVRLSPNNGGKKRIANFTDLGWFSKNKEVQPGPTQTAPIASANGHSPKSPFQIKPKESGD